VLLLHGLGTSAARTWGDNGWIDLLTDAGRTVLAPDLLGHGSAPKPHDPAAYDRLEELVAAELPDEPVDAVGFSLGARVLLTLASEEPHRFHRLVVAGVGANLFRDDGEGAALASVLDRADVPDDPAARYFHQLAAQPEADPAAMAALLRRPHGRPLDPQRLARVSCPVLVVLGDRDFAGPADPLLAALPDATHRPLPGVDHFGTPKSFAFLDAALEFLGAVPA
jgi:pimeloyl-ACP methyl ester carboxylesterase